MPIRRKIVLCVALYVVLIFISGIGCPFRYFLGMSCAGCGMTRACLSALIPLQSQLYEPVSWSQDLAYRLQQMWYYHPMVFVVIPLTVYAFFAKKPLFGTQKREIGALSVLAMLFLTTWLVRLAMGSEITACDLSQGVLTAPIMQFFS